MNFYFNYFSLVGGEQSNYTLYTIHLLHVDFRRNLLTFLPRSIIKDVQAFSKYSFVETCVFARLFVSLLTAKMLRTR